MADNQLNELLTELIETLKRDQRPIFTYEIKRTEGGAFVVSFENHRPYPGILRGATIKVTHEAPAGPPAFENVRYYAAIPRTLMLQGRPVDIAPPLLPPGNWGDPFWVYGIIHFSNFPDGNDKTHPYRICRKYDPGLNLFVYDPHTPEGYVEP